MRRHRGIRRTLHRRLAATALVAAACAVPGATVASAGVRADFGLRLSSVRPAASTGVTFHVRFKAAGDPDAKPSPIKSVVIEGPRGLHYDNRAAPRCTASDAELQTAGPSACPAGSRVGTGTYSALTGFGPPVDPFEGDDLVFNAPRQLIELITVKGTDRAAGLDRLSIAGSTLTAHPPDVPGGPPDGKTATRQIDFTVPARTAAGHSLVTSPGWCPPAGRWISRGTFGFADGAKETVTSTTPCSTADNPRARLFPTPRRTRAGHRTHFRFRLQRAGRPCLRRAVVTFAGRRTRVDSRGRASVTVTFPSRGRRWARAHGLGCLGPGAWVGVAR